MSYGDWARTARPRGPEAGVPGGVPPQRFSPAPSASDAWWTPRRLDKALSPDGMHLSQGRQIRHTPFNAALITPASRAAPPGRPAPAPHRL
ncbi:hypothetical protein GCM10023083_42870 [Streptomyces phyllanthi]